MRGRHAGSGAKHRNDAAGIGFAALLAGRIGGVDQGVFEATAPQGPGRAFAARFRVGDSVLHIGVGAGPGPAMAGVAERCLRLLQQRRGLGGVGPVAGRAGVRDGAGAGYMRPVVGGGGGGAQKEPRRTPAPGGPALLCSGVLSWWPRPTVAPPGLADVAVTCCGTSDRRPCCRSAAGGCRSPPCRLRDRRRRSSTFPCSRWNRARRDTGRRSECPVKSGWCGGGRRRRRHRCWCDHCRRRRGSAYDRWRTRRRTLAMKPGALSSSTNQ